jgi:UDP:flavonoid glycosyltransferase YjiC (YdhE family)
MDTPVDWAPGMSKHMRLKDFPTFLRTTDPNDVLMTFQLQEVERSEYASAVIVNSFDELERPALDAMRATIPAVYTIGPLASVTEQVVPRGPLNAVSCSLWQEDQSCLAWLDARKPQPWSVVYVNFGSVTVMSGQELAEFAWGLASSGHDFLWVVRPDVVKGDTSSAAALPPGFLEATKGRGLVASWCDQEAVLRHEAVGLFLTHSGWNSTQESLSSGVPMLSWPFFAEQQTNCRYKCVEWGVAMEVGDDVRREAVEATIREAMGGDKGKEMARRAAEWKEVAAGAAARSIANLDTLINDVLLSPARLGGSLKTT